MVYHGCMVDFGGSFCHGYICILLCVKLIACTGVSEISGGSVCHGYICILLYVKLIGCTGVAEISGHLETGWGVSLPSVYLHSSICETYWM